MCLFDVRGGFCRCSWVLGLFLKDVHLDTVILEQSGPLSVLLGFAAFQPVLLDSVSDLIRGILGMFTVR